MGTKGYKLKKKVCRSWYFGASGTWTKDMVSTKIITINIINKMFPKIILRFTVDQCNGFR